MRQRLLLLLVGLGDLNDSGMAGHMESRLYVIRVPVPSASFPKRGGRDHIAGEFTASLQLIGGDVASASL